MTLTLADALDLARRESFLAVVTTVRSDSSVQSSLVNAGAIAHPATGDEVIAYVTYGPVKLANLRRRPQTNLTFRSGWAWIGIEGAAELIGPDDPYRGVDPERLRLLLREIFAAAGGSHDDWDTYDQVMRAERRTAVLIRPDRVYGNVPP
jgi:PPOX class probable F420-dependent enzyme